MSVFEDRSRQQQVKVNSSAPTLTDAPAFFFAQDRGVGDHHVAKFLRRRPVGWELRQACELSLLARGVADDSGALAIESYLSELARRIAVGDSDNAPEATRAYAARLCAASQNRSWGKAARQVADAVTKVSCSSARRRRTFHAARSEHLSCVSNVEAWLSWLDRHSVTSEPVGQDESLRPHIRLIANLAGLDIDRDRPIVFCDAPAGSAWRKWFVMPGPSVEATSLWFVPDARMTRARQFAWHCLHDAAHLLHQELLAPDSRVFNLGAFPYWGVTEAFACWVERRAFSLLVNGEECPLRQVLDGLGLDPEEVLTVLVEGFIEREGRFYRALMRDGLAPPNGRGAPSALSAAAGSPSAVDFDALPSITWYYARGYRAFDAPPERISALLQFAEPFRHLEEFYNE